MKHLFLVLGLLIAGNVYGQKIKAVTFSFTTESTSFPFTRFSPIHPGAEIGIILKDNHRRASINNLGLNLGYYYHERLENAFYLMGTYAIRPKIENVVSIDFNGDIGMMYTLYPGEVYGPNSDGDFEQINQSGRLHGAVGLGIGTTVIATRKIQPFIRAQVLVQAPFASGIPAMIHTIYKVGFNIKTHYNEN